MKHCTCDWDYTICPYVLHPNFGEINMAGQRNVTAILRDIETIEKSKYLNNMQKAKAIRSLQNEMEEQLGQGELDLTPGTQVAGQQATGKGK